MTTTVDLSVIDAHLLIDGQWREASDEARQDAVSPATGERLGSYAVGTVEDVDAAVRAASAAWHDWAARTVFERVDILRGIASIAAERYEALASLTALETGKPLAEARGEVGTILGYLETSIEAAKTMEGAMPASYDREKRVFLYRVPLGVIGAIQPWNMPIEIASLQVLPALLTGNCVVMIPAPTTSLTAFEVARCFADAGLPPGVLNFVTGAGAVVGDRLAGHPDVQAVAFTGSPQTAAFVAARAAGKPMMLELGGNGPTVILDDADLERAVDVTVPAQYLNAGQVCTGPELFLVHEKVYDEFAERFVAKVTSDIRLGLPLDDATTLGSMHNEPTAAKVDNHVADAVANGARVLAGGSRSSGWPTPLYWEPTVLADVTDAMVIANDETFGPVAPLRRISSDEEALRAIDASRFGLASAVFTGDLARGLRFAERASTGVVNINDHAAYLEYHLPIGGRAGKVSGIGRCNGRYALEEFTEWKTIIAHIS
jgi:succinate-semialdehyde dehydrogenase/glutarate-semialdehyde dehydrogenase